MSKRTGKRGENTDKRAEKDNAEKEEKKLFEKELMMKFLDRLYARMKEFDVSAVQDEAHLRKLIMDRALASAAHCFTVSANGGEAVPIDKLPEEEREKHLSELMIQVLGGVDGPGTLLRRSIIRMILDYRLLLRLQEMSQTLPPLSSKHRRVVKAIDNVRGALSGGMLFMDAWPMFKGDAVKKEFQSLRRKLLEDALENPEAVL